jgi:hypothetical protein
MSVKFFISDGKTQQGPFLPDELKLMKLTPKTLVWYEGLDKWTPAENFPDLHDCFKIASPPPLRKKKNYAGLIIISAFFLVLVWFASTRILFADNNYYDGKRSVEQHEKAYPVNFLTATGTFRENFWGTKYKVDCKIQNQASVATYKDVIVEFTYYSKSGTALHTFRRTFYEKFPPNSQRSFDLTIDQYNNVNSVGWEVIDAVPL